MRPSSPPPCVVFFTNSVAMGGMEAHIAMLAAGLLRRGVSVAALVPDYETIEPLRVNLLQSGASVSVLGGARGAARLPLRLWRMVSELRRHRPFIFHLHNTGSDGGFLPLLAARMAGARAVVRTEHLPPLPPIRLRQRLLVRFRDLITDRVICVSEEAREQHIAMYGRQPAKLIAVPNGIRAAEYDSSIEQVRAARGTLGAPAGSIVIGAMGRMAEERKGFDTFIAMAALIAQERDNAYFVLVGGGPLRAELEKLSEVHSLAGRLRFMGAMDNRAVLPGMDVFVSPSISDGGPITVLEAMASGIAVVSTNIGVAREAIEDGSSGRLVLPRDARSMADAVISLCGDAESRAAMGARGRETVLARFTIEHMVERVFDAYSKLRNEAHVPPTAGKADLTEISG